MEWQPIETAPKDGTLFQAWLDHDGYENTSDRCWEPYVKVDENGAFFVWGRVDYDQEGWDGPYLESSFTHWMPLPDPPSGKDE